MQLDSVGGGGESDGRNEAGEETKVHVRGDEHEGGSHDRGSTMRIMIRERSTFGGGKEARTFGGGRGRRSRGRGGGARRARGDTGAIHLGGGRDGARGTRNGRR